MSVHAIDFEDYIQNFTHTITPKAEEDCLICYGPANENNQRTITLHCRHPGQIYHEECISTWLRPDGADSGQVHNTCPLCRATLWTLVEPFLHEVDERNSLGHARANDPRRDEHEPDDADLQAPTVRGIVENIYNEADFVLSNVLGESLDEEVILRLTGIDVEDTDDHMRFSKANRMLHFHLLAEVPQTLPAFMHLVQRGVVTSRLLERYYGEIDPQDWLALVADLRACRNEVRELDGNLISFLRGLWNGEIIWGSFVQPHLLTFETEISTAKGAEILTSYRQGPEGSSADRKIKYTLRENINVVAGFDSKTRIELVCRPFSTDFRIVVFDVDVLSKLSVSHEDQEIKICLADGKQINVRF